MAHLGTNKDQLLSRVRRIAGQMRAIEKAIDEEAECATVLHQVAGVRGAVAGLMEELIAALGACRRLGKDVMTVHPAFMTPLGFVSRSKVVEVTRSSLRRLDALSQELGVRVALENMPRSPFATGTSPEALLELIEGTEMGICLDIGHANTTGNLEGFLELKDRVINLHVHDNHGERDEHLPVGSGTVDFPRLLRSLSAYSGRYVIESRGLDDAVVSRDRLKVLLGP